MYTPKFSTKRALGLVMASALAVSGVVAVAGGSEAAVASVKLSPVTGSSVAGTVLTVTGKGFATSSGVSKVATVWFSTAACSLSDVAVLPGTVLSVVSATKLTVKTPTLALAPSPKPTAYNVCVSSTANAAIIGTGKFTSHLAPTVNIVAGTSAANVGVSPILGSSQGGGTIVVRGENFTSKTTATIGGLPLTKVKVEVGDATTQGSTAGDDTLTGLIPVGTGAAKTIVVTSEGGKSSITGVATFSYVDTLSVSPKSGDGTAANGITITGTGFLAKSTAPAGFVATPAAALASKFVIAVSPAATNIATGGAIPVVTLLCTNINVESDTSLTCELPDLTTAAKAGPYTVQIIEGAAGPLVGPTVSAVTASATYTVGAF
jgi:hypothetical protein